VPPDASGVDPQGPDHGHGHGHGHAHAHGHAHGLGHARGRQHGRGAFGPLDRLLTAIVLVAASATIVGAALLWPGDLGIDTSPQPDLVGARVLAVELVEDAAVPGDLSSPLDGSGLILLDVELLEGVDRGRVLSLELPAEGYPEFRRGDVVELFPSEVPGEGAVYFVADFRRTTTLAWLGLAFVGAVLLVGRWRGLRALVGLAASLWIVIGFMLPAILGGASPPIVALVGGTGVMLITLYLAHGLTRMTNAAAVGTLVALVITVAIAIVTIDATRITGFASEDAVYARFVLGGLDLRGIVLAGLIVAALGVLDDVTVSQSSTVFALHETDPDQTFAQLFGRGMRVGRDHIASVINTLFLAYAGASLALLLLFSTSGLAAGELVNSEQVATEIVKTVVGSLGLIAAVPLTTAIAAASAIASRRTRS
jgi:uncharacterized membrane protein